jgi:hypothetical protein
MAELDEMRAQYTEAAKRMGFTAEELARGLSALANSASQSNSRMSSFASALNSATAGSRQQAAAAASIAAEMKRAATQAKAAGKTSDEIRRELEALANSINANINDPTIRASVRKYADSQVQAAETTAAYQRAINAVSRPLQSLGTVANSTYSAYQGGAGQFSTSAALVTSSLDAIAKGSKSLGSTLTGIGSSIAGSGLIAAGATGGLLSPVVLFGGALTLAGVALSAFSTATEAASAMFKIVSSEVEKNINAFQSLSRSGALFTGGLDHMIQNAHEAGLTLTQLAGVVAANKEALAASGEGVAGGTNRMVTAIAAGGEAFRKKLLNLGFTVEEQAGLVADTLKDMRGQGQPMNKSPATDALVAEQTQKYAENLRIIANITGEDAKAKMNQVRDQANELAFQQKLAGKSAAEQQNIMNAMANMSDVQRKAFMETQVFGQAITPGIAAAMAQSADLQASVTDASRQMDEGTLDANSMRANQKQYGDGIRKDLLENTSIAMAGMAGVGGVAQQVRDIMQSELIFRKKWTTDAMQGSEDRLRGQMVPEQMVGTNPLTGDRNGQLQQSMIEAITQNQKLNVAIGLATYQFGIMETAMDIAAKAAKVAADALNSVGAAYRNRTEPQIEAQQGAAALQARQEESRLMSERSQLLRNMNEEERRQFEEIDRTGRGPNGEIPQTFFEQLARRQNVPVPTRSTTTTPPASPPANMTPEQRREWERTHPGQQIPPATPAGATRAATPDMNSNEGQRAAAENFYNGRATALPNGPTPPETPEQRQAREQTPATTGNNGRPPRTVEEIRQERREDATAASAPVVAEVQRLAALMTDVNRHLESIDRNINGVNQNTGTLVHLQ